MKNEATQEQLGADAADVEVVDAPEKPVNPRDAAMAEAVERARKARDGGEVEEPEATPAEEEEEQESAQTGAPPNMRLRDGKWFQTIKVDGVESEIPYEQALATVQKTHSADKRLAEAAAAEKRVQSRELQLKQEEQRIIKEIQAAKAAEGVKTPSATDEKDAKATAKKIMQMIFDGDQEGAAELMEQAIEGRRPATPEIDEAAIDQRFQKMVPVITQQIEERAQASMTQNELKTSLDRVLSKHKHIAEDPILATMHDMLTSEVIREKTGLSVNDYIARRGVDGLSYEKVYEEAATRLNAKLGKAPVVDRADRKRSTAQSTVGASATVPVVREKPEPTRDEYRQNAIANMKKARGQM